MDNENRSQFNWLIKKANNDFIKKNLRLMRGRIFDLGCGIRPYERDILKYADDYIGLDWLNTQHSLRADIIADLNNPLPIKNTCADTVVSFQVLEHLSEPQVVLNEAFRILKPNKWIFIAVPFNWSVHEAPYDFFRYTRYGIEHMFKKAGFIDIDVEEATGFWSMWFLKFNYQTAKLIRGPKSVLYLIRALLIPIWLFDQIIAPFMDTFWPGKEETAGYFVKARKP
jgi:SAM-dependent methyltransferase